MLHVPSNILIEDEFLRDGLQNEKRILTVDQKLEFLKALEDTGVKRIQVGSFVHPEYVPQMSNTDELFDRLTQKPNVTYSALILNRRGLNRAIIAGVKHLSISISASETHSQKNVRRSVDEAREAIIPTIASALDQGIAVRAGIQSALGCAYEGRIDETKIIEIAKNFAQIGVSEINIADTAGLATPLQVYKLCHKLFDLLPDIDLSLHLHDTRGMGIANMFAGLQAGVRIFDTSMGGLGGLSFRAKRNGKYFNRGRCISVFGNRC